VRAHLGYHRIFNRGLLIGTFASLLLAAAVGASACAGDPSFRTSVADGVEIVENFGPGAWADHPPALELVLDQVYGAELEPKEALLGDPLQLLSAGTAGGELYVLDRQQNRLSRFRKDGTVVWAIGKRGEGPGEFSLPFAVRLSADGKTLVISNGRGARIEFWSTDGEFLRSFNLEYPASLLGLIADRIVVGDRLEWRTGARVWVVQESVPQGESFDIDVAPDIPDHFSGSIQVGVYGGLIVAGSNSSYDLRFYTPDGHLTKQVSRDVPYPVHPGNYSREGRGTRHDYGMIRPPMALPGSYFMVHASWDTRVTDPDATAAERGFESDYGPTGWRATFDIFNPQGRFMQSVEFPGPLVVAPGGWALLAYPLEIGLPIHTAGTDAGEQPYLYARSDDPFPQIRRYKIEFKPPDAGDGRKDRRVP
jgi:hypothetical protein